MKNILVVIFVFTNIAFAQYIDESKSVKPIFKSVNGIDFYGAAIDPNSILHITLGYNSTWVMIGAGNGYSLEDITLSISVNTVFKSARGVFKKIPEAKTMIVYFVSLEDIRDSYGNLTGKNKKILCNLSLTRDKAVLLNWEHIENLLSSSFMSPSAKELLPYLDSFEFGTKTN